MFHFVKMPQPLLAVQDSLAGLLRSIAAQRSQKVFDAGALCQYLEILLRLLRKALLLGAQLHLQDIEPCLQQGLLRIRHCL